MSRRRFLSPGLRAPQVQLLSNGRYQVVITNAGGGYSRWQDLAVTRWREDSTRDCWGTFIYARDIVTGEFWSAGYQPVLRPVEHYEADFSSSDLAAFRQRQCEIEMHTQVCVSAVDDVELRRVTLTNHSRTARSIELTSYAEVVLAVPGADAAHPAFSNLFVQTEFVQKKPALLCTRRARSEEETAAWLLHLIVGDHDASSEISYETDRDRFVGRGRTPAAPAAMQEISPLPNTTGSVLDPVVSLRRTFGLAPGETIHVDFVLGVTQSRDASMSLVDKYLDPGVGDDCFNLAEDHSEVTVRQVDVMEAELEVYQCLAGALIYADPARRASSTLPNRSGQIELRPFGISGDFPIVLLRIGNSAKAGLLKQVIGAHAYWRTHRLAVDLLILSEDLSSGSSLYDQIMDSIASWHQAEMLDKPGGIFVRRLEELSGPDLLLLQSAARIVVTEETWFLISEVLDEPDSPIPALAPPQAPVRHAPVPLNPRELIFSNGLGGFIPDGREYVMTLEPGRHTPAPWVNVLANPDFGTVISESGSAYTWAENSHEFRLTPWSNDPITDASGEAFYIRDEQSGEFWSPTPLPAHGATPYVIRHGFGYSVFEHAENGIVSEMTVYVAIDAPIKIVSLKLRNVSRCPRRISVFGYWEWVLGDLRHNNLLHVQTEAGSSVGTMLARNFYHTDFSEWIAFIDVDEPSSSLTGDRKEFLGRNGTLSHPAALGRTHLSGHVGAGLDPCGAIQVTFDLTNAQERAIEFRLGASRGLDKVQNLIHRFRRDHAGTTALDGVRQYWRQTLGALQVETPDSSVNVLANGWLLYQVLSCRLWGRTGFYQSGGAFGFRDQLQDVMALVHAEPALTREHLLRAAAHQFREGDVEHWWHPPAGRGVRTHVSDDYLWLPYVTCRYVSCVGDSGVLDEQIPFLESRLLKPEEESYYDLPNRSRESGTLYEHCVRAIDNGLKFGSHGLPLMGSGDWNDGMNLVGKEGRGESVWLAFFLCDVLKRFAKLAQSRGDLIFADRCVANAQQLQGNIEQHGWDGQWYRRAYFDNGDPLGSQINPECQIDSLPQSWSVLSGAGDPQRSLLAMQAVAKQLIRTEHKLIQLLDPPFNKSVLQPGYIKGYVPGVRENGGQYTHAAVWVTIAFALLENHERAWELFALLNPIHHGDNAAQIATYKVEPYVVAADVYALPPHTGRGGWTWYTGSAGWMYRLLTETLLGINLEGDRLHLLPRIPKAWTRYKIDYRYRQTPYHITISTVPESSLGAGRAFLDGEELPGVIIPLIDDHREHSVELRLAISASVNEKPSV